MKQQSNVVLGLAWGDEGKGKIVHHLINRDSYDVCVRFNGGPNAGHTIYHDGKKIVTHGIPTGIVSGCEALIGPECVIDPTKLQQEIKYLESHGVQVTNRLKISFNAHLIDKSAIEQDRQSDQVGTTQSGIGPTYARKAQRINSRVADLAKDGKFLGCQVVDAQEYLQNKRILFEGAQGFLLDPNWGTYPYVTSSGCLLGNVINTGVHHKSLNQIWGVSKMYDTYVGKMEMMPSDDPDLTKLQVLGQEFGATTGRPRQCNWLNLRHLLKAISINCVTHLVFNKCDIIKSLGVFKLIDRNNQTIEFDTWQEMEATIRNRVEGLVQEIHFSGSPNHI